MNQPRIVRRDVDGVVLLDKPQGMTSNQALQVVKRLFRARKAGHTGSLDPLATGLLPICLGEATKVSAHLLDADKHYWTTGELGTTTRTGDAEGEVLERRPVEGIDAAVVESVLTGFRGEIEQVPPMYSALKQDGRRLYELARKGVEVERAPRQVTIHHLELLRLNGQQMELDVRCSKGTYIRTLVEDIGARLGCGAHVTALRRVGVSPYDEPRMWTLDALRALAETSDAALDEALTPLDAALVHWPSVQLDRDSAWYLCQGQAVWVPGAPTAGHLRLYGPDRAFLGIGQVLDDGRVAPKRLLRAAA